MPSHHLCYYPRLTTSPRQNDSSLSHFHAMSRRVRRKPTHHLMRRMSPLQIDSCSLCLGFLQGVSSCMSNAVVPTEDRCPAPLVLRFYQWCPIRRDSRFLPVASLFDPASCHIDQFSWATTLSASASSGGPAPSLSMGVKQYSRASLPQPRPPRLTTNIRHLLRSIPAPTLVASATPNTIHQLSPAHWCAASMNAPRLTSLR